MHKNNHKSPDIKPSIRLSSSPELGRYLVASRAFKPGEVVMKEYPLAAAPGPLSEHVCFGCHCIFRKAYICNDCSSPLCSRNCQSSSEHKKECNYLMKILPEIAKRQHNGKIQSVPVQLSLLMLPLRLLLLRLEQPDKWKLLMELEAHSEARKKTPIWGFIERNITPFLQIMLADEMPDLTDKLVQQICGAVDVNSFEIRVESTDRRQFQAVPQPLSTSREVLRGTYYMASLMAHSCVVNAQISITSDSQMFVKATVPIYEGDGIFVSYTDPLQTTLQRRNFLEKGKHFICRCRRCQDPTELGTFASGVRCLSCPSGWALPNDDPDSCDAQRFVALRWKCTECNEEINAEDVARTEEVVQNIVKNIQRLPVDRHLIDRCEELFLTLPKKIHSNHALLLQLRVSLIHLYGNVPGFLIPELPTCLLQRKAQLCTELLESLRQLCPGYSRLRGIILYELHVPLVCLATKNFENGQSTEDDLINKLKEAEIYLKESVEILIHEPNSTPESNIAKAAMVDLKQLREYIRDMEKVKRLNLS